MTRLRVGVVADLLEEGWPSMDLVAEMLMVQLAQQGPRAIEPVLIRPGFRARLTPFVPGRNGHGPLTVDRIAHRYWDYPRWLRQAQAVDVYHIVDHSYAHLAHELPAERVVVTCHDTDAFRTLMQPDQRESTLPRRFVRRVLRGIQRAAVVACDSEATRSELAQHDLVAPDRMTVVPIGVHPSCVPDADDDADARAAELIGPGSGPDLLHVGSTIPRKRIDTLLEVVARVAAARPGVRLLRVGGPFTDAQHAQARALGLGERIRVLPFIDRPVLASLYRRAAMVLLPSEREGFGLPLIEALACGTAVIASDIPVLREVGGCAAEYCTPGVADEWSARVLSLLDERETQPARWAARRDAGIARAARFSWATCAARMQEIYLRLAQAGACR